MPEVIQAAMTNNQLNRIKSAEKTGSYGNQRLKTSAGSKPLPSTQNGQSDSVRISAQGREMSMKMAGATQQSVESEASKYARQRPKIKFEDPPKMNLGQKSGKGGAEKQTIDPNTRREFAGEGKVEASVLRTMKSSQPEANTAAHGDSPEQIVPEKAAQRKDEQKETDNKRIEESFKRIKEESQQYKKYVEEGYKYQDADPVKLTVKNIKTAMENYKPTETFITSMQDIIKNYVSIDKSE